MSRETQRTLTLDLDGEPTSVTVVRATARIGVERYLLASSGNKENESETSEALRIMRLILYPDLISVTTALGDMVWPISFKDFVELPEDFVNAWADAVYALNPMWRPQIDENSEDELKKERRSRRE